MVSSKVKKLLENKHFKYGLPFMVATVGGSYGLMIYTQLKYDIKNERQIISKTKELKELIGGTDKTLEEEYADYTKTVDIDSWKNIRGPRPWETDDKNYIELIEQRAEEKKARWIFKK